MRYMRNFIGLMSNLNTVLILNYTEIINTGMFSKTRDLVKFLLETLLFFLTTQTHPSTAVVG